MTDHERWIEKKFNDALDNAEAAVERAESCGFSIENAGARIEQLAALNRKSGRRAAMAKRIVSVESGHTVHNFIRAKRESSR